MAISYYVLPTLSLLYFFKQLHHRATDTFSFSLFFYNPAILPPVRGTLQVKLLYFSQSIVFWDVQFTYARCPERGQSGEQFQHDSPDRAVQ
jgi:hypothetical protein